MPGALKGMKVLDLTRTLAGPFCTMQLADMGAEVIKVEEPAKGDETRGWPPFSEGLSSYFFSINRNKRSIALDLKNPKGIEIIKKLAKSSDVMIESFRTGALDRMGIGYSDIHEINPKIIYCSISGYGRTGPLKDKAGYDPMVQAYGGLMSITGEPGRPPVRAGYSLVDLICAWIAYSGIVTALLHRERTGEGQYLEASLFEGQVASSAYYTSTYLSKGVIPDKIGSSNPAVHPFQAYASSDGYFLLGVGNDGLWARFCEAVGRLDLLEAQGYKTNLLRVQNKQELNHILQEVFSSKTTSEWLDLLDEAGVPNSPINNIEQLVNDPQVAYRNMILNIKQPNGQEIGMPASPLKLYATPPTYRRHVPKLGEHTHEILKELGYTDDDLKGMLASGVIK